MYKNIPIPNDNFNNGLFRKNNTNPMPNTIYIFAQVILSFFTHLVPRQLKASNIIANTFVYKVYSNKPPVRLKFPKILLITSNIQPRSKKSRNKTSKGASVSKEY